jgi:lipocalin
MVWKSSTGASQGVFETVDKRHEREAALDLRRYRGGVYEQVAAPHRLQRKI